MTGSNNIKLQDIHNKQFESEMRETVLNKEILDFSKTASKWIEVNQCPGCSSSSVLPQLSHLGFKYFQCHDCRTLFINPCPAESEIIEFLNRSRGLAIWRNMPSEIKKSRQKLYSDRKVLIDRSLEEMNCRKSDLAVLEIGGGNCELAEILCQDPKFSEIHIIEPQPVDFSHPKLHLHSGSFSDFSSPIKFDLIVSFEVLEHLIDPSSYLELISSSLSAQGIAIISTPNADSLEVDYLQSDSSAVPFDHIRLYTPNSLRILIEKTGLSVARLTTPGRFDIDFILNNYKETAASRLEELLVKTLKLDEKRKLAFQAFLVDSQLSSHMLLIAKKSV